MYVRLIIFNCDVSLECSVKVIEGVWLQKCRSWFVVSLDLEEPGLKNQCPFVMVYDSKEMIPKFWESHCVVSRGYLLLRPDLPEVMDPLECVPICV